MDFTEPLVRFNTGCGLQCCADQLGSDYCYNNLSVGQETGNETFFFFTIHRSIWTHVHVKIYLVKLGRGLLFQEGASARKAQTPALQPVPRPGESSRHVM